MTAVLLINDAQREFYDTTTQLIRYGAAFVDEQAAQQHRRAIAATVGAAKRAGIPILTILVPGAGELIQPLDGMLADTPRYVKPTRSTTSALTGVGTFHLTPSHAGRPCTLATLLERAKVTRIGIAGLYTSACIRDTADALKGTYPLVTTEALLLDCGQRKSMPAQDRLLYEGIGALRENPLDVLRELECATGQPRPK